MNTKYSSIFQLQIVYDRPSCYAQATIAKVKAALAGDSPPEAMARGCGVQKTHPRPTFRKFIGEAFFGLHQSSKLLKHPIYWSIQIFVGTPAGCVGAPRVLNQSFDSRGISPQLVLTLSIVSPVFSVRLLQILRVGCGRMSCQSFRSHCKSNR